MGRGLAILVGVLMGALVTGGGSTWGAKSRGSLVEVEQAQLVSPQLGLVVDRARGVPGVIPRQRLLVGTSAADRFLVVGPQLTRDTNIDDVFFLDRSHGWIATWSAGNVSVHVYRTSDGGRHWHRAFVTTHTMGAGAIATLQFLTPRRGWLVNQQPTAPDASLYTTADGGQHWHLVNGELPEIAPVVFATASEAWQSSGYCRCGFSRSIDGGRHWTRVHLAPAQLRGKIFYGPPRFVGRQILEPLTVLRHGRANLVIYRSSDGGRSWRFGAHLDARAPPGSCSIFPSSTPVAVSLVNSTTWWVAFYRANRWLAYRTIDAGQSWARHPIAQVHMNKGEYCGPRFPALQAVNGRTAWLTFTAGPNDSRLYVTNNGGSSWRRIFP